MYKLILIFIVVITSFAVEIDLSIEKKLSDNDVINRLLLVNYYFDKNITKAKKYNEEILKIDKNNKIAIKNEKKIKLKEELLSLANNKSIDEYYKDLYYNKKYKKIKNLSKYLSIINTDYPKLVTARVYLWDGDYDKVSKILGLVKDKNNLDYVELKAYQCFYKGYYKCSKNNFSILYNATGKLEYAYKLIDSLLYLGETDKAYKLVNALIKRNPNDKKLIEYAKKLAKKQNNQIQKLRDNYKKTNKFSDLQKLVYVLLTNNKKEEAYKLLEDYIKKHPTDVEAKYWYATYLSWEGNNKKALQILENIVTDHDYKTKLLMAKIYSWNAEYEKAINYANDVIVNSNDKNLILDAKELEGLIYFWQQDYEMAKPILQEVLKYKDSQDAKEALMVINGNLKPLIAKYKKLYNKDITNLNYILKVAEYSQKIGDTDTAIKFYEKYYNLKPSNLNVAHTLAQLYLQKKDYYKAFSYYEYWAYSKGDVKSLYELAKEYYYAGYSKSALNVINDILKLKKYKPALTLKAKILRYSPKFTQNNDSKTVNDIFMEKNSKILEVANRLYFNGFYDNASLYYRDYLLDKPNDAEIRQRYAYSLEFSDQFKQAAGEFFLVTWQKKDCEILYHYGYNLEKSNKEKQAKEAYKEALKYAIKPAPKFILDFIEKWKKAWESQDINKYKQYYDDKYKNDKVWVIKKQAIFNRVNFISLYLTDISLLDKTQKEGYDFYKIRFWQQYSTNKKVDKGYKTLELKCKDKKCVIYKERWSKGTYIPVDYRCEKAVNERLEKLLNKKKKENNITKIENNTTKVENQNNIEAKNNKPSKIFITNQKAGLLGYYYKDKTDIKEIDYGLFYENNLFYLDVKKWKLWQDDNIRDGKYLTFHYKYNKFLLGFELGEYEDNSYFYPYIEYRDDWTYRYYQSITGKDMKTFCAVDNNLITHHLIASKYKGIKTKDNKELTDKWYSLELSKVTDNQDITQMLDSLGDYVAFTPQFMYRFDRIDNFDDLEFYYYLSGWYQFNSTDTDCYYSPDKYDSTYLELHPVYKKLELIGKIGYSIDGKTNLYSYGFDYRNKWFNLGCMKNFSYKQGYDNYWYEECHLKAGIEW